MTSSFKNVIKSIFLLVLFLLSLTTLASPFSVPTINKNQLYSDLIFNKTSVYVDIYTFNRARVCITYNITSPYDDNRISFDITPLCAIDSAYSRNLFGFNASIDNMQAETYLPGIDTDSRNIDTSSNISAPDSNKVWIKNNHISAIIPKGQHTIKIYYTIEAKNPESESYKKYVFAYGLESLPNAREVEIKIEVPPNMNARFETNLENDPQNDNNTNRRWSLGNMPDQDLII